MEIYSIYQSLVYSFAMFYGVNGIGPKLYLFLSIACGVWLVLFVLQGFGLFAMAKNAGLKKKWMAFVPFLNFWYAGKLAGTCNVFGRKMKRAGLYTMIAQILVTLVCAATTAIEILLFTKYESNLIIGDSGIRWQSLSGGIAYAYNYYDRVSSYLIMITQLVYEVLLFILVMGLYKKYYVKGYLMLSWVTLFFPFTRFIIIFVLRNNKAVDYEAYMRARREAFARRQGQYGNPYGNPYNPYSPPYGNGQYGQGPSQGSQSPYGGERKPEDPFAEFSRDSSVGNSSENASENSRGGSGGGEDSDDLFN